MALMQTALECSEMKRALDRYYRRSARVEEFARIEFHKLT